MPSEKLAALGGEKVVPEDAVHPWPHVTDQDRAAVMEVLQDGNLAGQRTAQAEGLSGEFAQYLGVKHVIPCNSGTAALHMAVAGVGVQPGDEVICPSFTYWATAAAVLHHNAIPVFVDVEPDTLCMDPSLIEQQITDRTAAIIPVHIHGMPATMDAIMQVADKHNLAVIEDCAQAHGGRYKGNLVGAIGKAAGFSTQMTKLLTTGSEGGLFASDDDEVARRAQQLNYLGEIVTPGRESQDQDYNAYGLGWMYRGDVFGEAFVRSQLKRLDENNELRRQNCELLIELLADIPGISTPSLPADREMVWYTFTVQFDAGALGVDMDTPELRGRAEIALNAEGVPCGRWQRMPVPAQDIFQARIGYGRGCPWTCQHAGREVVYDPADYPVAQAFVDSNLYINGIWPPNDADLMRRFAEAFEKVMSQPDELQAVEAPQ